MAGPAAVETALAPAPTLAQHAVVAAVVIEDPGFDAGQVADLHTSGISFGRLWLYHALNMRTHDP